MKNVWDLLRLQAGVLVPMVNNVATTEAPVKTTRYPQQLEANSGVCGCAAPFVCGNAWGFLNTMEEYLRQCEEDLLVMVQVETLSGVEAITEITNVPGVDAIFLGSFDLLASIGKMGQMDDSEVRQVFADAKEAVWLTDDCLLAGFRSLNRVLKRMFDKDGYSLVCGSVDMAYYERQLVKMSRQVTMLLLQQ
jgi:4-hydroxy-2-oxoheptanedioate aldolase